MIEAQHYIGRTVMVTGGSGYIGSALVAALSGHAKRIIRISRRPQKPAEGIDDIIDDPSHPDVWEYAKEADVVFHLAGETSTYSTDEKPAHSLISNVLPVIHAIAAIRRLSHRPALIIAGTVTQVGMPKTLPVDEDVTDDPVTVYDLHKLMAEKHLKLAVIKEKIRGCCLRLANVYGPSQSQSRASDRGVINKVVSSALSGKNLTVFGNGKFLRDYIYIDDVISAFLLAGITPKIQNGNGWIIASGIGTLLDDAFTHIASKVSAYTNTSIPITYTKWPTGTSDIEFRNFIGNSAAFSAATGWAPRTSFEEGIRKTIFAFGKLQKA